MTQDSRKPSMAVWISALLTAGVVIVVFHFTVVSHRHFIYYSTTQSAIENYFKNSGNTKVLIIGNSLVRHAFPFATPNNSSDFMYLRIQHAAFSFEDFLPVLNVALAHNPDFIFIQSDLFYRTNHQPENKLDILKYLILPESYTRQNLSFIRENVESDDEFFESHTHEYAWNMTDTTKKYSANFGLKNELDYFFEKFRESNSQIIFIDIPRYTPENFEKDIPREVLKFARLSGKPNNVAGVSILPAPPRLFYTDPSHLNQEGRKLFINAFMQKMDSLILAYP